MVENVIVLESQHEAIEEQLFWPAVRKALADGDHLADQAVAQEKRGKKLLQGLNDGEPGERNFQEALAKFIKAAREHIAYEEEMVWPRFAAVADPAELDKVGSELEAAKKIAPTRPHPDTPSNAAVQKTLGAAAAMVDHAGDALSGRSADVPPDPPRP